jgi:acetyl esterase
MFVPAEPTPEPAPGLVFFHGGGWVFGDLDTHDAMCRSLAHACGCRVIAIGYRLAPEHAFPAAVEDSYAATVWVEQHAQELGLDRRRIAIGAFRRQSGGSRLPQRGMGGLNGCGFCSVRSST